MNALPVHALFLSAPGCKRGGGQSVGETGEEGEAGGSPRQASFTSQPHLRREQHPGHHRIPANPRALPSCLQREENAPAWLAQPRALCDLQVGLYPPWEPHMPSKSCSLLRTGDSITGRVAALTFLEMIQKTGSGEIFETSREEGTGSQLVQS